MIVAKELADKIDQAEWATDELRARMGEFILELDKDEAENVDLEAAKAEADRLSAEVEQLKADLAKQKADHDAWVINKVYKGIIEDEVVTEEDVQKQMVDDVDKEKEDEIEDFDVSML